MAAAIFLDMVEPSWSVMATEAFLTSVVMFCAAMTTATVQR